MATTPPKPPCLSLLSEQSFTGVHIIRGGIFKSSPISLLFAKIPEGYLNNRALFCVIPIRKKMSNHHHEVNGKKGMPGFQMRTSKVTPWLPATLPHSPLMAAVLMALELTFTEHGLLVRHRLY